MSTEALLKTRTAIDALRAAFVRGSHGVHILPASELAAQLYPYATGTRPRVVSVAFGTGTYEVSIDNSRIRVEFGRGSGGLYDDIFHLAYTLRMDQASFDVIQELIANPTETYELPDDADGATPAGAL